LVKSIGADEVIDYTKDDFTDMGRRYDLIVDNVGNRSLLDCRRALNPNGRYILIGGGGPNVGPWFGVLARPLRAFVLSKLVGQQMGSMLSQLNKEDLAALGDLMQAGKLTPVIDRRYRLEEVPAALEYLETGHARGKVVITLEPGGAPASAAAPLGRSSEPRTGPALIALGLFAIVVGVPLVPLVLALVMNRRFRRRNPGKRSYRWGYYFSMESFLAGLGLGILLEAGVVGVILCGVVYAVLAWFFARRSHWAWLTLTVFSFNPVVWIVNLVYLRKRWAEDSAAAG